MPNIPLPAKSEPFSSEGFERLYEKVRRESLAVRAAIAKAISEDAKAVLEHAFRLSQTQQEALGKASKEYIQEQAGILIKELHSDNPGAVRIIPDTQAEPAAVPGPIRPKICSCSCIHPI